jgi:hypothetical protein
VVWVLEATAIAEIFELTSDASKARAALSAAVSAGQVHFTDAVCKDIERIDGADGPVCIWLTATRPLRSVTGPEYASTIYVAGVVPDLIDPDSPRGCVAEVAALAYELDLVAPGGVTVVTEDVRDKTRMSLTTACAQLSLPAVQAAAFMTALGIT